MKVGRWRTDGYNIYLDECDEILHGFNDFGDGKILQDIFTDADDLTHLRFVKSQQKR